MNYRNTSFRHSRGTEPSARHRQVGTTQVTLLHLETMGVGGLPGTTQARGNGARSVEHQQVGAWAVAAVEDTGADHCITIGLLQEPGSTEPCSTVRIQFIKPPDM